MIGLLSILVWLFVFIGRGGHRSGGEVEVVEAMLHSPQKLELIVASCNRNPKASLLRESDVDVQVRVKADSDFRLGEGDCLDGVEVHLQEPLGDRTVIDKHTGKSVSVIWLIPYTIADTQPSPDWRLVEAPGGPNRAGFSLRLPPGWELDVVQVSDSHEGEIAGDGALLAFDFGGPSWSLSPTDDPEHTYIKAYEDIAGVRASLLISMDPGSGYTAAFFHKSGGPNLHIVGEDLTPEQQRTAVAVFRSIRLPEDAFLTETDHDARAPGVGGDVSPPEIDDHPSSAEIEDLQAVADQEGITLQEAIDRYGWHNNFSLVVSGIQRAFPDDFARSEIVGASKAWVGFAGSAPEGALEMLDRFTGSHSGVSVEVRTDIGFTELEIQEALRAVHFAMRGTPEALDAVTYFEFETRQIRTTVLLDNKASDSVLDDLRAIATESLVDAVRPEILDIITVSVVCSKGPILVEDD